MGWGRTGEGGVQVCGVSEDYEGGVQVCGSGVRMELREDLGGW